MTGGSHRDRERRTCDPDLERFLDSEDVLAVGARLADHDPHHPLASYYSTHRDRLSHNQIDQAYAFGMEFDAINPAGGRGSRLGGERKERLVRADEPLLSLAIRATESARRIVIVGDVAAREGVMTTREDPPFAGPVAAIAAGLAQIPREDESFVLVLACDVPDAVKALPYLRRQVGKERSADGVIAVDEHGVDQYLLAIYSTHSLRHALRTERPSSMRQVIEGLTLTRVRVPPGSTRDVDTWTDAAELGVSKQEETHALSSALGDLAS
ncbi:NTP transferase domain-containing protein [Microbacterium sp. A8/3-1]|uniref:NTP transferase domain-containing protein n=1 Tax=Microbacterium sp. A8/3-1 TaxID=3160749 RepID=A0AAU7VVC2_9MICO